MYLTCGVFWIKFYTIILYFLVSHWQKWNSVSVYITFPHGSNSHLVQAERRSDFRSIQVLRIWHTFARLEVCKNKRKQTKNTIVSFVARITRYSLSSVSQYRSRHNVKQHLDLNGTYQLVYANSRDITHINIIYYLWFIFMFFTNISTYIDLTYTNTKLSQHTHWKSENIRYVSLISNNLVRHPHFLSTPQDHWISWLPWYYVKIVHILVYN